MIDFVIFVTCFALGTYSSYRAGWHASNARWHRHMMLAWGKLGDKAMTGSPLTSEDFFEAFGTPPSTDRVAWKP